MLLKPNMKNLHNAQSLTGSKDILHALVCGVESVHGHNIIHMHNNVMWD